jgi:hypothetical protein
MDINERSCRIPLPSIPGLPSSNGKNAVDRMHFTYGFGIASQGLAHLIVRPSTMPLCDENWGLSDKGFLARDGSLRFYSCFSTAEINFTLKNRCVKHQ